MQANVRGMVMSRSKGISGPYRLLVALILLGGSLAPAANAQAQVNDSFSRPDSATVGNGWIEKNPQAFSIVGGAVVKQAVGLAYRDNIVYRPAAEDLRDVEAAAEFRLSAASPGYPQIFTRVQSGSVALSNRLDGYILYVNNSPTQAILGRQNGDNFVTALATLNLSPGLNTTDTYRLRLRATGTAPVQLAAFIERQNGANWVTVGQATASDNNAAAITSPGSVGFGGYVEASYSYDNFSTTDLGNGSNPVPVLTSINPASATAGGSAFSLTVNGSNFVPGSLVRWNGTDRPTTYVSPTQLQAAISDTDIATAGSADVNVFNAGPGGGLSGTLSFTINSAPANNPVPVLTNINPNSATAGGPGFTLTVNGSNFIGSSVVRWNGANRTTTYVSPTQLQATITAADIATAGNAAVTVFNPGPGGGLSASQTFTINAAPVNNPVPALTSINPNAATAGDPGFTLTLNGNNFIASSVVRWNGANRTTTYVSPTQLQANIPAADVAAAGSAAVTVFNPGPGGGLSAGQTFTINAAPVNNPVPTLTSINPNAATAGDPGFSLTVLGSNFVAGSVVRWNGADRATTFVSSSELRADISTADLSSAGNASVSVFNPAPGGGVSSSQTFTVSSNGSGFFDSFSRPDSATVGNGWIEKNPQAFSIVGGAVVKQAVGLAYRDNIVYRPAAEDLRDVEAAAEFRLSAASPGYPQIFTRVQSGSVALSNRLDGYILYVNNSPTQAILGRQNGDNFVTALATLNLSPGLNTTDTYRLRLRATGTAPVQLAAFIERQNGANWVTVGQATASDNNAAAITSPGSVGFGGYVEASYSYDNFSTTDLGNGSNPVPVLTSINPASATAGGSAFSLTVNGSNFVPGSLVRWNGTDRPTTYVSPTQLQAAISDTDIATAGSADVNVFNAGPGGGLSGTLSFTINSAPANNPVPVLTNINPNSATAGGPGFTLTVNGSNFIGSSVVRWNGANRTTTYVSPTQLQATITAADIATAGNAAVTVFNPGPGGGLSASQTFTINAAPVNNPVPALTSINPNAATAGDPGFTLTLNGNNFIASSVVRWNGANRTTTYVSPTQLQANIPAADVAAAGSAAVTVFNPGPGGGLSAGQTFTVNAGTGGGTRPTIASTSPERITSGSAGSTVTIIGNNFNAQSVAYWNGDSRATTFISNQTIEMTLSSADLASQRIGTVTVINADAPGDVSAPHPLFVLDTNTTYFFDGFNTANSSNIGNGWTEKTPEAFSITNNAVTSIWFDRIYRDSIVYRPVGEDRRDLEVSAEFVRQPAGQFTQLHARATRSTITTPDYLESYIFYVEDNVDTPGAMAIAIGPPIQEMGECIIDQIPLPQPLVVGERYRMRFLITGVNPVRLEGRVEWFSAGEWQPFFEATVFHDESTQPLGYYCAPGYMPSPITAAGATGFSKWVDQADDYDNYYWIDLSGNPEVPVASTVSPDTVTAGDPGFTLVVQGAGFVPGSVVQWNGQARSTTFVDTTTLQAAIPASDIATESSVAVTVMTPPPGGGVSNALTVTVLPPGQGPNPSPALSDVSPAAMTVGQGTTQLTVLGGNFTSNSIVRWNGSDRATAFVSAGELVATIPATDLSTAGTAAVSVFTPAPGGGNSTPRSIAIVSAGEFFDDFSRADSAAPQNGWIEKNPAAFSVVNRTLQKNSTGFGYRDNVVYRPSAEIRSDVTTSVEFTLNTSSPGYPQIFARLQPDTVATGDVLNGYILYINNSNVAVLGRQVGSAFVTTLASIPLSEALAIGTTYRMRLSATGTNPVALQANIERLSANGFVTIGTGSAQDATAQRFAAPGLSAIGGFVENAYSYDNFRDRNQN
jgi:IPT/TIG domain